MLKAKQILQKKTKLESKQKQVKGFKEQINFKKEIEQYTILEKSILFRGEMTFQKKKEPQMQPLYLMWWNTKWEVIWVVKFVLDV